MNKIKGIALVTTLFFSLAASTQAVYEDLTVTATKKESTLMDTAAVSYTHLTLPTNACV